MRSCSSVITIFAASLVALFTTPTTLAAPLKDLIDELPGYGRPPTPHFSGYLDASEGCDTKVNGPVCKIHYWLAMADDGSSRNNNEIRPTVLWLNGGPGSSSLLGYLQEVGPLMLNATGGLMDNPWGWTKANVNLMAIEAPMGVGFSYCSRQVGGFVDENGDDKKQPCVNTDTNTAQASRAALVDFFANKFPELVEGGFYIAGESYAGVYIPTLSKELLTNEDAIKHVPLKGILVGDPCTDNAAQADSMDSMWYSHKYGLMDNEVYDVLTSDECADTEYSRQKAMHHLNSFYTSKSHRSVGKKWSNHVVAAELNEELKQIKDRKKRRKLAHKLYQEKVLGMDAATTNDKDNKNDKPFVGTTTNLRSSSIDGDGNVMEEDKCKVAYRKFLMSSSDSLSQGWGDLYIDDYSLFAPVTSLEDEQMAAYFNRADVRKALHVTDTLNEVWPMPSVGFDYTKEYNACNWQGNIKFPNTTMVDVYRDILPKLDRVWVYNGDTDPCVSYEGTREAVKQILQPELDGGSYRPWFYRQEAASLEVLAQKAVLFGPDLVAQTLEQAQFAGEVTSYENGLSFVTFHGSGHMVPQFRPQSSLHFLKRFLYSVDSEGEELSPLLPSNATLAKLSDDDFGDAMEDWTKRARDMADATQ